MCIVYIYVHLDVTQTQALVINKWRRICSVVCRMKPVDVDEAYKSRSSLETCYQYLTICETSSKVKSWVTWPNVGGESEGPNFGNVHTRDSRMAWPILFKLSIFTMQYAPKEAPGGGSVVTWPNAVCVRGWRHIFNSPRAVDHPGTWWVLVVISITVLLLNLLLYSKCLCHGASLVQIGTPVTNNVGDSRCHRAVIRTTDTVRIRIAIVNVWTDTDSFERISMGCGY